MLSFIKKLFGGKPAEVAVAEVPYKVEAVNAVPVAEVKVAPAKAPAKAVAKAPVKKTAAKKPATAKKPAPAKKGQRKASK
jgi:hypothetical protein